MLAAQLTASPALHLLLHPGSPGRLAVPCPRPLAFAVICSRKFHLGATWPMFPNPRPHFLLENSLLRSRVATLYLLCPPVSSQALPLHIYHPIELLLCVAYPCPPSPSVLVPGLRPAGAVSWCRGWDQLGQCPGAGAVSSWGSVWCRGWDQLGQCPGAGGCDQLGQCPGLLILGVAVQRPGEQLLVHFAVVGGLTQFTREGEHGQGLGGL